MLIASLVFALLSSNANAATSCRSVLERKIEPRISTLHLENGGFYVGSNLMQIKTPVKDQALFASNGQFGMTLVTVDLKNKIIQSSQKLGDTFLRYSGYSRLTVLADGKAIAYTDGSEITIFEPTKKGFKKVASADFGRQQRGWTPWTPAIYVHKDQVFNLSLRAESDFDHNYSVVSVGRGKSANKFIAVAKTAKEIPDIISDGRKIYGYDSKRHQLDVLDPVTEEVVTHKFKANKGLRFDEFKIHNAERLEDDSVLLTGYNGWIRLDANMKLVNQDSYRDSFDQDNQAILWNIDKTSDRQGSKFALPVEKDNGHRERGQPENQSVLIIDTVTGGVKTIPVPEVKRVFLNKDGSMVFETVRDIKVLDQNGKEIKSFKLPLDKWSTYPQKGDLSRIDDHTFLFTSSPGKNLLIEL